MIRFRDVQFRDVSPYLQDLRENRVAVGARLAARDGADNLAQLHERRVDAVGLAQARALRARLGLTLRAGQVDEVEVRREALSIALQRLVSDLGGNREAENSVRTRGVLVHVGCGNLAGLLAECEQLEQLRNGVRCWWNGSNMNERKNRSGELSVQTRGNK